MSEFKIAEIKARVDLIALVGLDVTLKRRGADHWGLCPFHVENTPSFKVNSRLGRFKCFGCDIGGDAFEYLHLAHGMSIRKAIAHLAVEAGLAPDRDGRKRALRTPIPKSAPSKLPGEEQARQDAAIRIWRAAQPAAGTLVETYLRHRGITIPVPPTIRYHAGLVYQPSGIQLPGMVVAVQAPDRSVVAVHRTFLRLDGRGKAGVRVPKMALGSLGAGAVRLGPIGPVLGLAEGVETGMSVMQLFDMSVWCALGSRLDHIEVPPEVCEVHVFGDNGVPGHSATEKATQAFTEQGRRVFVRYPADGCGDWNDHLNAQAAA